MYDIKTTYPNPGQGSLYYIKDDPGYPVLAKEWGITSKQTFYILSGSDALKLLYRARAISVHFERVGPLPAEIDRTKIVSYTAKFPY